MRVVYIEILGSTMSSWLAFSQIFFIRNLKLRLLLITNPRMFSLVTFLVVVFPREQSGKGLSKSRVRKLHLSSLSTMKFS